jgi:MFS family permease
VNYLREFRLNWRHLAAASIGMASGHTLNLYIANVFAPHLLREFGWSKSQFALSGVSILLAVVCLPIAGRLTDMIGVRRILIFGIASTPFIYLGYSLQNGAFGVFLLLNLLQVVVGAVTTSLVYSRLIAQSFDRRRGMALGIAASAAPAVGGILAPLLAGFIAGHGWRTGYIAVAVGTALGGAAAFLLIPRQADEAARSRAQADRQATRDYREILRNPAFHAIAAGMALCNLTLIVQSSQLKLILLDTGAPDDTATMMLPVYASAIIVGRLLCGLALDRFPTHIIATIALGMPALGQFILASGMSDVGWLVTAVALIGLAMGAELDVLAYLVMRYFKVVVYSTVYGLLQPTISLSAAIGSLLLSLTLKVSDGFGLFLYVTAGVTLIGSGFFLLLGRLPTATGLSPERPMEGARHDR